MPTISRDVLFGFGVVVGAKTYDLLELGFGVFDLYLMIVWKMVWPLIGEFRVVVFVLSFLIILVADADMTRKDFLISFDKTDKIRWITRVNFRVIDFFVDLLVDIRIPVITVDFDKVSFGVNLD